MELSPGVELVWSLAGREMVLARTQEVEPEHFLCALLKFSEMDDSDLEKVASGPSVAKELVTERDEVRAFLKDRSLSSAHCRHDLRRVMGRGSHEHTGGSIHRSDASRQLFEQAARLARQDRSQLESRHLLQALLDSPTPAMAKVMGGRESRAPAPVEPEALPPFVDQYIQDLAKLVGDGGFDVPTLCAPQVQVLKWAIQSADPSPVLLVCEPRVSALPLLGRAAQESSGQQRIARLDHAAIQKSAANKDAFADQLSDVLGNAAEDDKLALFLDATEQAAEEVALLLSVLRPSADGGPRVILAVSRDTYSTMIEPDSEMDRVFRVIWLHELKDVKLAEL
jgi:ATP-dependent Clp protease ATP-binding subunit ClpA